MERPQPGTKIDPKEELGPLYVPSDEVILVEVPELRYVMINGDGEPTTSNEFSGACKALHYLSFALMFTLRERRPELNYAVMPLEALFWQEEPDDLSVDAEGVWRWSAMVMVPDLLTEPFVKEVIEDVIRSKKAKAVRKAKLDSYVEGAAVQVLHKGPFTDEGHSVGRLHDFASAEGYAVSGPHHEIYLTDPQRVLPHRMRTILRQPVTR
jgi:hypothetical protein